jgi:hypothetical protein
MTSFILAFYFAKSTPNIPKPAQPCTKYVIHGYRCGIVNDTREINERWVKGPRK